MIRIEDVKGLKPCPFCGNEKPIMVKWHERVYSVFCGNERYCSCEIGNSTSISGIKKIWNRRRTNNTTYEDSYANGLLNQIYNMIDFCKHEIDKTKEQPIIHNTPRQIYNGGKISAYNRMIQRLEVRKKTILDKKGE